MKHIHCYSFSTPITVYLHAHYIFIEVYSSRLSLIPTESIVLVQKRTRPELSPELSEMSRTDAQLLPKTFIIKAPSSSSIVSFRNNSCPSLNIKWEMAAFLHKTYIVGLCHRQFEWQDPLLSAFSLCVSLASTLVRSLSVSHTQFPLSQSLFSLPRFAHNFLLSLLMQSILSLHPIRRNSGRGNNCGNILPLDALLYDRRCVHIAGFSDGWCNRASQSAAQLLMTSQCCSRHPSPPILWPHLSTSCPAINPPCPQLEGIPLCFFFLFSFLSSTRKASVANLWPPIVSDSIFAMCGNVGPSVTGCRCLPVD